LLFPVGVDTTVPVSYYKDKLLNFTNVPVADYDTLVKAHDKSQALRIAEEVGVPVPKTYFPKSKEDVLEISEKVSYPVIIKRRKGSGVDKGVRLVRSKTELLEKYKEIESLPCDSLIEEQKLPMIQEYIPGEIRDVCVLFNQGEPRAALVQRRVWTWPPRGGVGIVNETISDEKLREMAIKLMKKLNWHGLAQVEFKLDAEGKPRLMEINPKFWGTLELSIKAGIDFPYLLYKMALEGDVDPVFDYEKNLTFLWVFPYDMNYILEAPGKLHNFKRFIKLFFSKKTVTDISLIDPGPEMVKISAFIMDLFL